MVSARHEDSFSRGVLLAQVCVPVLDSSWRGEAGCRRSFPQWLEQTRYLLRLVGVRRDPSGSEVPPDMESHRKSRRSAAARSRRIENLRANRQRYRSLKKELEELTLVVDAPGDSQRVQEALHTVGCDLSSNAGAFKASLPAPGGNS